MAARGQYWAALPGRELGPKLVEKVSAYFRWSSDSGRTALIRKCSAIANGLTVNGTGSTAFTLTRGGEQGELVHSVENHFASIGDNLVTITTAQRPTIQCSAANSDYRSLAQALLANGLVDYYLTERRLEDKLKRATRNGVFLSEGFILLEWDANAGEAFMQHPEIEGATIRSGDIKTTVLGPMDVIRDARAPSWDELSWLITREYENKHELAPRYPELAESIVSLDGENEGQDRDRHIDVFLGDSAEESDLIPVYKFFHRKTQAMPDGRLFVFLDDTISLFDGALPYSDLPIYRVVHGEIEGKAFGKTVMFHLLGPQDAINALDTSIITNQLGRGIGNIIADDNADVSVEELSSSMNLIKKKQGTELKPLEWPDTPVELFKMKAEKISAMETLSGVSSVVRGNPSENIGADASGAKLALIQAQSVQTNSGLQASYTNLIRDVALGIIHRFRDFGGDVPRLARLAGKNNQYLAKEFTSTDLSDIDRVTVDVGSPLMRTVSGKMSIADKLVEMGVIKTADQYLLLVKAGTYEPLIEGEQSAQMRIRGENERLMEGRPVVASLFDPHWIEVKQHQSVLDNPALREPTPENQAIQQVVLAHIEEHRQLFLEMPPDMVVMTGGMQALELWQAAQGAMATPPMPGEQSGTPPPESGAEDIANPMASQEEQPGLPSMPSIPDGAESYAPEALQ